MRKSENGGLNMPSVLCSWINCKYNTFKFTDEMKLKIAKGIIIEGVGTCIYDGPILLKLTEEIEESLICYNYLDGDKY
jgi:hypothetical protein